MKQNLSLRIRKIHRYLGLFLGIQFTLWTLGGLYFSWSNLDEVHGDHQRQAAPLLATNLALVSPKMALENIQQAGAVNSLLSVSLVQVLGLPVYQVTVLKDGQPRVFLADALTGRLRPPLSQVEATAVARAAFRGQPVVQRTEYLTATGGHHEYRQQPLPAYAVTFASGVTVYVATQLGTVQKVRNNAWRVFDFLWMLHTMDYSTRDNIGNWLLRAFSVFGLLTILSGFVLFGLSSKTLRRIRRNKKTPHVVATVNPRPTPGTR